VGNRPKKPSFQKKSPTVTFREEPAGRETLAAIAEEFKPVAHQIRAPGRIRTTTKHYGDRISNAPGAVSPKSARAMDTSPEVTVTFKPAGRETYATIVSEHRKEVPDIEIITDQEDQGLSDDDWLATLEIEQIFTFVVHAGPEHFQTPEQRRRLVEKRLLTQMKGVDLRQVTRVDVTPSSRGDRIKVKVWVEISE
jgi:hypothetical protein